mmetsp:Transcript_2620/g.5634  ORF Transcript_2620/g.5634 Transcript_2620/m.5634 type:complete len:131 (+) Transcript_2620:959-1351(+)
MNAKEPRIRKLTTMNGSITHTMLTIPPTKIEYANIVFFRYEIKNMHKTNPVLMSSCRFGSSLLSSVTAEPMAREIADQSIQFQKLSTYPSGSPHRSYVQHCKISTRINNTEMMIIAIAQAGLGSSVRFDA